MKVNFMNKLVMRYVQTRIPFVLVAMSDTVHKLFDASQQRLLVNYILSGLLFVKTGDFTFEAHLNNK